jgi:hypothetical protein
LSGSIPLGRWGDMVVGNTDRCLMNNGPIGDRVACTTRDDDARADFNAIPLHFISHHHSSARPFSDHCAIRLLERATPVVASPPGTKEASPHAVWRELSIELGIAVASYAHCTLLAIALRICRTHRGSVHHQGRAKPRHTKCGAMSGC